MVRILEKIHRIRKKSFRIHNTGWILIKKSEIGMLIYIVSQAEHARPQRHRRAGGGGETVAQPEQVRHRGGSSTKEENQKLNDNPDIWFNI